MVIPKPYSVKLRIGTLKAESDLRPRTSGKPGVKSNTKLNMTQRNGSLLSTP
ncbi:Uncharacterized protein OBRU01_02865, partial [Operophtera brumata]